MRRLINFLRRIDAYEYAGACALLLAIVMGYVTTQHFDDEARLVEIASRR